MAAYNWRDIPGFEGLYQVSRDGEVKSLGRTVLGGCRGGYCLKTYRQRALATVDGAEKGKSRTRIRVNLYPKLESGKSCKTTHYVYDLVALAFGAEVAAALPEVFHRRKRA